MKKLEVSFGGIFWKYLMVETNEWR